MSAIWFVVVVEVGIIKKAKDFYSDKNTVNITCCCSVLECNSY